MKIGIVEGHAISTVKHRSMEGWRLLIVQPVSEGEADGDPLMAIDMLGARHGDTVVISNDGKSARDLVGDTNSPVRWTVTGIVD
jgi:ethanolamine utilization protein EutN